MLRLNTAVGKFGSTQSQNYLSHIVYYKVYYESWNVAPITKMKEKSFCKKVWKRVSKSDTTTHLFLHISVIPMLFCQFFSICFLLSWYFCYFCNDIIIFFFLSYQNHLRIMVVISRNISVFFLPIVPSLVEWLQIMSNSFEILFFEFCMVDWI